MGVGWGEHHVPGKEDQDTHALPVTTVTPFSKTTATVLPEATESAVLQLESSPPS